MDAGERTTGTRDEHFDLISVLYHALQGADACELYAFDAETSGDERLAAFFREAQATQRQLAERAKGMLGIGGAEPGAGGIPPEEMPGDVPSRSADVQREPDVRADEVSVPTEGARPGGVPPTTDVPRTPPEPPGSK